MKWSSANVLNLDFADIVWAGDELSLNPLPHNPDF